MKKFATKSVSVGLCMLAVPMFAFLGTSCTDLSETPHDALTPENAFHTDAEILAVEPAPKSIEYSFGRPIMRMRFPETIVGLLDLTHHQVRLVGENRRLFAANPMRKLAPPPPMVMLLV